MKSKANYKGHPLHPILVSFPIAFFVGTLAFDVLGLIYNKNELHDTAMYLEIAGIGFALLAAVPGIIDYIFIVPPKSSAKKRATTHGLVNMFMLIIFGLALILRRQENFSFALITGLEITGVILLSISGWLGGTLVYRNQIGVDIRYAEAGKWKEEYITTKEEEPVVAVSTELKVNQMKLVHLNGKRIVIAKTEHGYTAFDDHCTHRGGSLAGGAMICGTVQCPWHGSQFDAHTGRVTAGPAKENIKTYIVTEVGGKVILQTNKQV